MYHNIHQYNPNIPHNGSIRGGGGVSYSGEGIKRIKHLQADPLGALAQSKANDVASQALVEVLNGRFPK